MKNLVFILIAFSLFFILSCSNKSANKVQNEDLKVYQIEDVKLVSFPLDSTKNGKPLDAEMFFNRVFDYCYIDNIETLIIPINRDRLAFYDINSQKEYHSIKIAKNRDIINFSFVNKDSIFVFYDIDILNYDRYEPVYMHLIDYDGNGKVCEYYLDTLNFEDNSDLRLPFITETNLQPTITSGNVFFMTQTSGSENIGSNEYLKKHFPLFAYYNSNTKNIKFSKSIEFPHIKENVFYNTYFRKIRYCLSSNNLPLLRFFYSSTLYEWDYINDKVSSHTLNSKVIDSIKPLPNENSLPQSLEAVYGSILYDKYNEMYYSFVHLNEVVYGNYYTLLILADKDFNYLGEMLNPNLGGNFEFYEDNIISYYYSNDSIHVSYQTLKKTDKPLQPYLDSIKGVLDNQIEKIKSNMPRIDKSGNENILHAYIKSKFPNIEKDYVLLTLYANGSCPSCLINIKQTLNQNYEVLADLPFYLIYSGTTSEIEQEIFNYENLEKIKIVKDSLGIVKNMSMIENKFSSLDPRVTVIENNVVIIDTVYNWLNQSKIIPTIMENLGLKQTSQKLIEL